MTKYHLIGIKGSGMSALAQILDDLGYDVQGSDVEKTYFTQKPLEERGIPIFPFSAENIKQGLRVIASAAFGNDHVEMVRAQELKVPVKRYYEFLGEFAENFTSIAVTGTHGKTSTTGMLSHVLKAVRPTTFLIGDGTGKGEKNSQYFAFEACEYRRHFLAYKPDYLIITNIDFDHPDYFKGIEDVMDAFHTLATQVKRAIVGCGDDPHVRRLNPAVPLLTYGLNDNNDLQAKNVRNNGTGMTFDVVCRGDDLGSFSIPLYGMHNVLNSLSVIGLCMCENYPLDMVKQQLMTFGGVKRRFSEKVLNDNIIIDDYAHHPTEIRATIEAVRTKYPNRRLVSIFQPHTFTRTKMFLDEFAHSLSGADEVYLCDIFGSAREKNGNLRIDDLLQKIPASKFISEDSVDQLQKYSDAVLLFMGAGDIQKVQHAFENLTVV